jgi:hypothetical protein
MAPEEAELEGWGDTGRHLLVSIGEYDAEHDWQG